MKFDNKATRNAKSGDSFKNIRKIKKISSKRDRVDSSEKLYDLISQHITKKFDEHLVDEIEVLDVTKDQLYNENEFQLLIMFKESIVSIRLHVDRRQTVIRYTVDCTDNEVANIIHTACCKLIGMNIITGNKTVYNNQNYRPKLINQNAIEEWCSANGVEILHICDYTIYHKLYIFADPVNIGAINYYFNKNGELTNMMVAYCDSSILSQLDLFSC